MKNKTIRIAKIAIIAILSFLVNNSLSGLQNVGTQSWLSPTETALTGGILSNGYKSMGTISGDIFIEDPYTTAKDGMSKKDHMHMQLPLPLQDDGNIISETETNTNGISINTDASIPSTAGKTKTKQSRCALCFFGLPRSYATMVLPSIEKHILKPNANYICDIFVHYFYQNGEAAGRYNNGGSINPDEILLLKESVQKAYQNYKNGTASDQEQPSPRLTILYTNDTNQTFYDRRASDLHRYHTTLDRKGKPKYFPWKEKKWVKSSLDNMIRQWHSVEGAFRLMRKYAKRHDIDYTRVAMLRNDVVYLTPIDIMRIDNGTLDTNNEYFVIPNFARYPVNDRMIYGPHEAVKIWATKRFDLVEERVENAQDIGMKMHSESFMNASILPAIQALGYKKSLNRDICFFRSRTSEMLMTRDCFMKADVRGFVKNETNVRKIVEDTVDRNCSDVVIDETDAGIHFLYC